jgi:hypothetical protein
VKLVTKLALSSILALAFVLLVSSVFMTIRMRAIIRDDIAAKATVLIKTFESQCAGGYEREGEDGSNLAFNLALASLSSSFPDLDELAIYKIETGKVVASNIAEQLGKVADPEDLQAAKEDRTLPPSRRSQE